MVYENEPQVRDAKGRFLPGSRGGPGRPSFSKSLKEVLNELGNMTLDEVATVAEDPGEPVSRRLPALMIVKATRQDDRQAITWCREIFDRLLGRPHQAVSLADEEGRSQSLINILNMSIEDIRAGAKAFGLTKSSVPTLPEPEEAVGCIGPHGTGQGATRPCGCPTGQQNQLGGEPGPDNCWGL